MNPLDPNTQNSSSLPTSPVATGQGAFNDASSPTPVDPTAVQASPSVQPGAVFEPSTSSETQASETQPGAVDTATMSSPDVAMSSSAAADSPTGTGSPLHPEVLATDLWGSGDTPPPETPQVSPGTPWYKNLWLVLTTALVASLAVAGGFYFFGNRTQNTTINNSKVNENYVVTSVPLSDLAADQILSIDNDSQLSINGQLRINNSAVIEATTAPDTPELGQLWLSSENNTLYYYNGTQWVPVSTTIGGVGGTLSVGGGISLSGSTIVNSGVTSLQGQTGAVSLNGGGGISISGTTISVSGVQQGGVLVGAGGGIGTVLPSAPGLCLISNGSNLPEFGSCTGQTMVNQLNGFTGTVNITAGSGISVSPSGNAIQISTTGGGGVSALEGLSGSLNIEDASAVDASNIRINRASGAQLGLVQGDNSTVIINGSGVISIGQNVATNANVTFNQLTLTTPLAVGSGGTGANTFAAGGLLVGDGSNPLGVVTALSAGQCLLSTGSGSAPSFQNCPVGGNISQGTQGGEAQTAGRLAKYGSVANSITNSIIGDDGATATVNGALSVTGTISGNGSGITNVNAQTLQGNLPSAFEPAFVTLGVSKGGTGQSSLTANAVLVGNGTTSVQMITAGAPGLCFMSNAGAPSYQSCPVGGNVTANSGTSGFLTMFDTDGIDIVNSVLSQSSGNLLSTGKLTVRNDATNAFVVQQSALGNQTLVVDTTNNNVGIGFAPPIADIRLQVNGAGQFFVNGSNKPAASSSSNGAIYYDTTDGKFKIIEGDVEKILCNTINQACGAGASDIKLQTAYGGGNTIDTADARDIAFNLENTATDSHFLVDIQSGSTGRFAVQNAGSDVFGVDAAAAYVGSSSQTGDLVFKNSVNSNTVTLTSDQPSSSYTLTLPNNAGNNLDCLKSNGSGVLSWGTCVTGGSGGGITGSGTLNSIALFTPNGQSLGDSIITQPSGNLIDIEGDLRLGTAQTGLTPLTGKLELANSGSDYTVTLQSGVNTGNFTLTLPTDDGGANQCLKTDGNGVLGWVGCLSGSGSGGGVTELNNIVGDVDILGTANQITVSPAGQNITLSLPQDIATSSNVTFGSLSLTGAGQLTLGTVGPAGQAGTMSVRDGSTAYSTLIQHGGALTNNHTINIPDAPGTLAVSASGNIALSSAGNITFTGTLPVGSGGTGATTAGAARTNLGAAASGANSDITSLSAVTILQNSSGSLTVGNTGQTLTLQGGASTSLSATSGADTNSLVFATPTGGNKTITIPNETGTICLQSSGSCGFLTTAVTSLQTQTGALTLTGGTGITINPGSLTITNAGVTSLAGTANQITASGATGSITLSLPNDLRVGTAGSNLSLWNSGGTARAILQTAGTFTADRTITIPDAPGTLAVSATGNIALSSAGNITFTGTLPVGSGGTGATSTPTNGQILIGNGSGYTVATLTQGTGVAITNGSGSIEIAAPSAGTCATCANQALSNLSGTGIASNTIAKLNSGGTALVSSDLTDNGTNIVVGDVADANQTVTIQGGNTASAVSIQSQASGRINIGTANAANTIQIGNTANGIAQTIGIGNNATASSTNTVTIGSLIGSSATTIQGGTGASAINIVSGTNGTITIGSTNGTSQTVVRSGSTGISMQGLATSGTALTMNANSVTTGTGFNLTSDALTTGNGINVTTSSGVFQSGNLARINQTSTITQGLINSSSLLNVSRSITTGMAASPVVTLDNVNNGTSATSSSISWTHTVGNYTNRAITASVGHWVASVGQNPTCTATYGGVSMTLLSSATHNTISYTWKSFLFGLANPSTGSNTLAISCSQTGSPIAGASSSWYNVDQTTPFGGATSGIATSTTLSLNVTGTTTSDKVVDSWWSIGTSKSPTSPQVGYGWYGSNYQASYKTATASPTTVSWTTNQSGQIAYAAAAVKAVATASTQFTGNLASLTSNCMVGTGGCIDSSNILDLNQQYAGATGAVLNIQNAGTGLDIQLGKGGIQTAATNATSTASNGITLMSGNALGATSNSGSITIDSGTATGTTGNIFIGNSNAMTVTIGNTSAKLGAWQNASGYNIPANRVYHGAAIHNGYAYVVGGQLTSNINTAANTVYYAKLKADGTIPTSGFGVWTATTAISVGGAKNRTATQAVVVNGYLYVIGGFDETTTAQSTVYYAKINNDGSVGSWSSTSSLPGARGHHKSFAMNGYIYAVGGLSGSTASTAQSTVYYARVNADGTLGTWATTQPIGGGSPVNRYAGAVSTANGYVYYSGGADQAGTEQSTVYYAKVNSDGTIPSVGSGVWTTTNAIVVGSSQPRSSHSMVASNGYLYIFGGSGTLAVYAAPINNDGTIGTWSAQTSLPAGLSTLAGHSTLSANGYFYTIGGYYSLGGTVYNTVYISSTSRVRVGGNLDLIGTDNSGLTEGGAGGQLTAGNTRVVGTFEVSDQANFIQGVSIGGNLTVGGKGTDANPIFAVQNSSGASLFSVDTQNNNITIGGNNSAELQTWATNGVSLPANRNGVEAVSANGSIYVVGGSDGSNPQDEVYYAKPLSNGSIGSWTTSSNPLPAGQERYNHTVVAANGYLYAIGGYDNSSAYNTVYYSRLNPDGSNGAWTLASSTLPAARLNHSSVYANGYIYVIGGEASMTNPTTTIYYAKVNPDGSLGSWNTEATNVLPAVRNRHSSVYANGRIYVLGGTNGTTRQSTIYYASVNSNGSIGTWTTSANTMHTARDGHNSVVINGYIYSVGGINTGGSYLSNYEYTAISSSGANGASAVGARAFADGRHNHGGVVMNGYVYVIGGANASAQDEVYYASTQRVSVGGTLDLIGINGTSMYDSGNNTGGGSLGGELTAGNTNIVGSMMVQGQATFSQDVSVLRNLNVGGDISVGGTLKVASDSATALRITKSNGTSDILVVDNSASVAVITINASIALNGRIITSGSAPSTSVDANAGTGASCTVNGNDTAGTVTLTSGSGGWATGTQCTLTFNGGAWANAPRVVLTPSSSGTNARQIYGSTTTTTFVVGFDSADSGANVHTINYVILR